MTHQTETAASPGVRRALVHNAITKALSDAGDWVPLSVRLTATRAALAEVDAWHAAEPAACAHCGSSDHTWDDCEAYTRLVAEDAAESAAVSAAVAPVLPSPKDTAAADESPHIYLTAIRHQAGHAHDFTKAGRMTEALEHVEAIERLLGVYRRAVGAALDQVRRLADEMAAPEVPLPFTHTDDDSDQLEIGAAVASTYTGEAPVVYVAAEQHQGDMVATVYVRPERVDELVAALRAAQVAAKALPVAEVSQDGVTA